MAELRDLSLAERLWYHRYRFRPLDPIPFAPLARPLSEARVGVVTTAGLHLPEDPPFQKEKGGDFSFRVIPEGTELSALKCTHPSSAWDRSGVEADPNLALPLDRLAQLVGDGFVGELAPRHLSFQGSITAPGRLVSRTAPEAAALFVEDQVDLVLLTPV